MRQSDLRIGWHSWLLPRSVHPHCARVSFRCSLLRSLRAHTSQIESSRVTRAEERAIRKLYGRWSCWCSCVDHDHADRCREKHVSSQSQIYLCFRLCSNDLQNWRSQSVLYWNRYGCTPRIPSKCSNVPNL